jgi:hypothetical protein
MGRKPKLTAHQRREAIRRHDRGGEMLAEIGRSYNVSGWTISRLTVVICRQIGHEVRPIYGSMKE